MIIDSRDIEAAQQIIAAEGWPSRDRAPMWLARVLRVSAHIAARHVRENVEAEREACAEIAEACSGGDAEVSKRDLIAARIRARVSSVPRRRGRVQARAAAWRARRSGRYPRARVGVMSALEWRSYGTGSEVWIGPIRCSVYKRGLWVVDLTWRSRPGSFRDGGRHPDEDAAKRAAQATAAAWLREEIASLTSALATLEAPPHSTPQTLPTSPR